MSRGWNGIHGSGAIYEKSRAGISSENPKYNTFAGNPIQAAAPGTGSGVGAQPLIAIRERKCDGER